MASITEYPNPLVYEFIEFVKNAPDIPCLVTCMAYSVVTLE